MLPAKDLSISVTGVNDPPSIQASSDPMTFNVAEGTTSVTTVTATDPEGDDITYSITGGADSDLFEINSTTGALSFKSAPDRENPQDAGTNNVYDVEVTATDNGDPKTTDPEGKIEHRCHGISAFCCKSHIKASPSMTIPTMGMSK